MLTYQIEQYRPLGFVCAAFIIIVMITMVPAWVQADLGAAPGTSPPRGKSPGKRHKAPATRKGSPALRAKRVRAADPRLAAALASAGVALPFVFLTGHGDVPSAVTAMRHGAVDFLDKRAPQETVIGAVVRALERDATEREARTRQERLSRRFGVLTAREREVLRHVIHGRMNKQISADLGIHERTVKLHRTAITTKLGVRSVAELTTLARDAGVLE